MDNESLVLSAYVYSLMYSPKNPLRRFSDIIKPRNPLKRFNKLYGKNISREEAFEILFRNTYGISYIKSDATTRERVLLDLFPYTNGFNTVLDVVIAENLEVGIFFLEKIMSLFRSEYDSRSLADILRLKTGRAFMKEVDLGEDLSPMITPAYFASNYSVEIIVNREYFDYILDYKSKYYASKYGICCVIMFPPPDKVSFDVCLLSEKRTLAEEIMQTEFFHKKIVDERDECKRKLKKKLREGLREELREEKIKKLREGLRRKRNLREGLRERIRRIERTIDEQSICEGIPGVLSELERELIFGRLSEKDEAELNKLMESSIKRHLSRVGELNRMLKSNPSFEEFYNEMSGLKFRICRNWSFF